MAIRVDKYKTTLPFSLCGRTFISDDVIIFTSSDSDDIFYNVFLDDNTIIGLIGRLAFEELIDKYKLLKL